MKCIFRNQKFKCVRFGFLYTFVITKWLYGSNPQGQEAIEAITVCHVSSNEFFFVSKESKGKGNKTRSRSRRR